MFGGIARDSSEKWRSAVKEFGDEDVEGRGVVNVVPERENDCLKTRGLRGGYGFGEDGGGAPGDVGEGLGMGAFQADKVVAAIVRGAISQFAPKHYHPSAPSACARAAKVGYSSCSQRAISVVACCTACSAYGYRRSANG